MTVEWKGDEFLNRVLIPSLHDGLERGAQELQKSMGRVLGSGSSPSSPGQPPGSDIGRLANSIVYTKPRNLHVDVGSTMPYSITLEQGATITAKGKKLTVPLSDKAKRVRRQNSGEHGSLRSASVKLSFIRTPSGAYLIRNVGGKSKRTEFWYKLVDRVTIAPRPWLDRSVESGRDDILRQFTDGTIAGLKRRVVA